MTSKTSEKKKASRKQKILILLIVFLAIFLFLGFFGIKWYLDICTYVTTEDAKIIANNIHVSAKIPGRITKLLVDESDFVKQNQLVAELDTSDLLLALKQAKTNLEITDQKLKAIETGNRSEEINIAKIKVAQSELNLNIAEDDYKRSSNLYKKDVMSKINFQKSRDNFKMAKQNYDLALQSYLVTKEGARIEDRKIAKAQVIQAKNTLAQAESNYNNAFITAPISGEVALKSVNSGEYISPGQTLFTLIDPKTCWVQANIKETDITKIKISSLVIMYLDAYPGKKFRGRVTEIGVATNANFALFSLSNSSGNFVKVVQNIPVKISFSDAKQKMPIGSSVKVKIRI